MRSQLAQAAQLGLRVSWGRAACATATLAGSAELATVDASTPTTPLTLAVAPAAATARDMPAVSASAMSAAASGAVACQTFVTPLPGLAPAQEAFAATAGAPPHGRTESLPVRQRIGHAQAQRVDAQQFQPLVKRPRRVDRGQRTQHLFRQLHQYPRPQPLTCLAQRGAARRTISRAAGHQATPHLPD